MSDAHCEPGAPDAAPAGGGRPTLLLAGNPNVGKTTLFNALTGATAKVSNYPGITVDKRSGELPLPGGVIASLVDLPGTYSLNARSAEEQIAFDALTASPDAVIVCLDATQLARSAYLLAQIQELGERCVVALTMVDEAKDATPDVPALRALLGCEVVAVTARTGHGLPELRAAIDRALRRDGAPVWRWTPSAALRARLDAMRSAVPSLDDARALWALTCIDGEDELEVAPELRAAALANRIDRDQDDEGVLARWAWLDREIGKIVVKQVDRALTQRVDRVLLHRALGGMVFATVMTVMFMALFTWSEPAIDLVDRAFKWLGGELRGVLGEGVFTDFLVDGVIGGVGSVMVFLPQILLLFLFLGFLEDCGYLARVAYLMDRIMRTMNLHGRAFVPMLSGFACAVPAILATRTMERRRDRILTMMVVPLMTCSARLPVYTLVIAALIPGSYLTQALLMVGMYVFSVVTALAAAWIMSKTVKPLKAKRLPFLIELPPYRLPRWRDVLRMMWNKSSVFLREAGTVILGCSIALWALLYFPRELPAGHKDYAALIEAAPTDEAKTALEDERSALQLANSYGGRLGHAIEPAIAPLGFDWKIGVGIIGAFAAREVFVSTLGIVYAVGGDADEESESLREALRGAYTPLMGLSLMIFFALACQCMSTLAVVKRETGGYRWPAFLFGYMTVLAWTVSFLVYQGGKLLGFG
ncbi:MAG: ferrous iron transport protein B [Myxococcales bacterium]|nr:ferrous iron transport protein B [Myxococcales bacterium]